MRISLLALLCFFLWNCNPKKDTPIETTEPADYVPIKGKIENGAHTSLFLYLNDYSVQIRTDEKGSFIDTLLLDNPGIYEVEFANAFHKMYLENGGDIDFTSSLKSPVRSLTFFGKHANKNNALADINRIWEKEIQDDSVFYSLPKAQFEQRLTQINQKIETYLQGKPELGEAFLAELKNLTARDILRKKLEYPQAFANFNRGKKSENFDTHLNPVFLNPDSLTYASSPSYKQLVLDFWNNKLSSNPMDYKALKKIQNKFIRDDLTETFADLVLQGVPNDSLEKVANKLQENVPAASSDMIKERVTNLKATAKGATSPTFKLPNVQGESIRLADFSGSKVYIDLWATWCKPCLDILPDLKKLENEFAGKNVSFVSISIDEPEDKQKWLNAIKKYELSGNQLFRNESFDTFLEMFNVNSIPRFILLDEQGKILHAHAPRPDTQAIRDLLKS